MTTTSNAALNPYTRHLLASVSNTQAQRPVIEKAKAAEAKKPVSQHLIERAKEMNARIRLRKIEDVVPAQMPVEVEQLIQSPANGEELLHQIGQKWQAGRHVWREVRVYCQLPDGQPLGDKDWKGVQEKLLALGYQKPVRSRKASETPVETPAQAEKPALGWVDLTDEQLRPIGEMWAAHKPVWRQLNALGFDMNEANWKRVVPRLNAMGLFRGKKQAV